jgi:large subunit ribosomal protein L32e
MAKKHPKFERQNRRYKKRISDAWRKPRGIDNSQRVQKRGFGKLPRVGYGTQADKRGLHPSAGLKEKLVFNAGDLEEGFAARIGGSVGAKKKGAIVKAAKEKGIKVLNE